MGSWMVTGRTLLLFYIICNYDLYLCWMLVVRDEERDFVADVWLRLRS